MASVTIEGYLTYILEKPKGFILSIMEPKPNHLAEPIYHRVAIWGKKAAAIAPKLRKGTRYQFHCQITYTQREGRRYTNFTVEQWLIVATPPRLPKPLDDRDEDWFVPEPINRDHPSIRQAEGFEPAR